ncbi:interferon-induced protein 44-like [Centroberyx affinis]|uniref:interferon-induced protein 44-like n=1 Tax=Centroberyx affinis TaxID=166261 RepID=UPI003A5C04B4
MSCLSDPWRKMQWGDKERDLQYVKDYQPHNEEVKHLRILLHGPVGAGKSSFLNSVNSVMQGRMTGAALVDSAFAGDSFTKKYTTYKIQKGNPRTFYSFIFNDIMGLEKEANKGVRVEDIRLAMRGHVRDGYEFSPLFTLSKEDQGYNSCPTLDDKVHVLVCVIPADTVSLLSDEVVGKMMDIRVAASNMGIPQVGILTRIDKACPEVDKSNVYKNKLLKKKMEEFSSKLGIPVNHIFPVKNYSSEICLEDDIDSLILCALRQMIDFGEDFFYNGTPDRACHLLSEMQSVRETFQKRCDDLDKAIELLKEDSKAAQHRIENAEKCISSLEDEAGLQGKAAGEQTKEVHALKKKVIDLNAMLHYYVLFVLVSAYILFAGPLGQA